MSEYEHLGEYSDWVAAAQRQRELFPLAPPGLETQAKVREVLGFTSGSEEPQDVRVERAWTADGVSGQVVTWSVGYGPRTEAYVLRPADADGPLPGVLALHDHGGFKFYGKEKIADGPDGTAHPYVAAFRADAYGGRAYANALAKEGFTVLVPDTFLWGSRRFAQETMLKQGNVENPTRAEMKAYPPEPDQPYEIVAYNRAAGHHEHSIAKYCNLLGTTLSGVVCYEDRVALNYLRTRPDVVPDKIGCLGLSGGGNRTALLQATHDALRAAVIVGLMSTYAELLSENTHHTWMFFPFGWSRYGDWPDLAACRAPSPLLVQYDEDDELFTLKGMQDAHERIAGHYQSLGAPEAYTGQFYPGPHKFDLEMQAAAFAWLKAHL